jgi:hypothetical protein
MVSFLLMLTIIWSTLAYLKYPGKEVFKEIF